MKTLREQYPHYDAQNQHTKHHIITQCYYVDKSISQIEFLYEHSLLFPKSEQTSEIMSINEICEAISNIEQRLTTLEQF